MKKLKNASLKFSDFKSSKDAKEDRRASMMPTVNFSMLFLLCQQIENIQPITSASTNIVTNVTINHLKPKDIEKNIANISNTKDMSKNKACFEYPCNIYTETHKKEPKDTEWTSVYNIPSVDSFGSYSKIVIQIFTFLMILRHMI